jgi:hypothetical protein
MRCVDVLKQTIGINYNARATKFFSMELNVKFRQAVPADLKTGPRTLNVGQTYAITKDDGKTVNGVFSLRGDEDPFILKYYLDHGWLLVPENDPSFVEWIQDNEEQLSLNTDYMELNQQ